jgi:hypothetical protein
MYPYSYFHYVNLPKIPNEILKQINYDFSSYNNKTVAHNGNYRWTDSHNKIINDWCQRNICKEMYWAFQIISGDLSIHKDKGTKTKFIYLLEAGGDNVITEFYDEDKTSVIQSVVIEPYRWHVLKVDSFHCVKNINPGKIRFSITGKIF